MRKKYFMYKILRQQKTRKIGGSFSKREKCNFIAIKKIQKNYVYCIKIFTYNINQNENDFLMYL